ncbi:MAG: hypothetical protein ACHQ2Z_13670 [Elusimicrobiota bacterium]
MRLEKSRSGMHHMDGRLTAQRRSAMKQKLVSEFPPEPLPAAVSIDYPTSGERVVSREYTFRISADPTADVEVSVDDEAWRPCRRAAGFWWHDWTGYREGPHSVVARISRQKGRRTLSARRDFRVDY